MQSLGGKVRPTLAVIVALFIGQGAMAQQMPLFTLGAGDVSGGYYSAAWAICDVVNRQQKGTMRCSPDPTSGSVYNIDALRRGELDFALVQSDLQAEAFSGTGRFLDDGPMPEMRSVMGLYPETMTILVRADLGVTDIQNLKGARVDLGHPSSGRRATIDRMFSSLGISEGDFSDISELPVGIAVDALCNSTIDATFLIVGHPNESVARAIRDCDARILALTPDQIAKVIGGGKDLTVTSIPLGAYTEGALQVPSFSVTATLVARADTPQRMVEAVVADTLAELQPLGRRAPVLAGLDPVLMQSRGLTAPLHPGAETAFARAMEVEP